jgi:undecaprenyl-diphosphatase
VFAAAAALATVFLAPRIGRVLVWALALLAIALVGFSRVELGVHWTTDVVASVVWTGLWLLLLVKVLRQPDRG